MRLCYAYTHFLHEKPFFDYSNINISSIQPYQSLQHSFVQSRSPRKLSPPQPNFLDGQLHTSQRLGVLVNLVSPKVSPRYSLDPGAPPFWMVLVEER